MKRWSVKKVTCLRVLTAAFLVLIYYQLDWRWLRLLLRGCSGIVLSWIGHQTHILNVGDDLRLAVDQVVFSFTANCTYAVLILMVSPFCWRRQLGLASNVLRLAGLAISIQIINVIRIVLALHLSTRGMSWQLVHDVPHTLLHYVILIFALFSALKWDRLFLCEAHSDPKGG